MRKMGFFAVLLMAFSIATLCSGNGTVHGQGVFEVTQTSQAERVWLQFNQQQYMSGDTVLATAWYYGAVSNDCYPPHGLIFGFYVFDSNGNQVYFDWASQFQCSTSTTAQTTQFGTLSWQFHYAIPSNATPGLYQARLVAGRGSVQPPSTFPGGGYSAIFWVLGTPVSSVFAAWSSTRALVTSPASLDFPLMLYDQIGSLHLLWSQETVPHAQWQVRHKVMTPDGAWSQPTNVTSGEGIKLQPRAVVDSTSTLQVVFENELTFSERHVQYTYLMAGSQTWSSPIDITRNGQCPDIAIDTSGSLHVVWNTYYPYNQTYGIMYANKPKNGEWSSPTVLENGSVGCPSIVADGSDKLYAFWDMAQTQIKMATKGAQTWAVQTLATTQAPNLISTTYPHRIVPFVDANHVLHLAWEEFVLSSQGENQGSVHYAHRDSSGRWSFELVSRKYSESSQGLSLGVDAKGTAYLAWVGYDEGYNRHVIQYAMRKANMAAWSTVVPIHNVTSMWYGDGNSPTILISRYGVASLAWTESFSPDNQTRLYLVQAQPMNGISYWTNFRYPVQLQNPWNATWRFVEWWNLEMTTNSSSIKDFAFDPNATRLSLLVEGPNGTRGFTQILAPKTIFHDSPRVTVNDVPVAYTLFGNSTHFVITFSYKHSSVRILVVPEFLELGPLLGGVILLAKSTSVLWKARKRRLEQRLNGVP